jgi:hypothetical protein
LNSTNTSSVIPPTIGTYPFNSNRVLLTPPLLEVAPALQEVKATALGRPGGKCDLYTASEDGHFIGHDGFVVPRSFEEFSRGIRGTSVAVSVGSGRTSAVRSVRTARANCSCS